MALRRTLRPMIDHNVFFDPASEYGAVVHPRIRLSEKSLTVLLEQHPEGPVEVEVYDEHGYFVGRGRLTPYFDAVLPPSDRGGTSYLGE